MAVLISLEALQNPTKAQAAASHSDIIKGNSDFRTGAYEVSLLL